MCFHIRRRGHAFFCELGENAFSVLVLLQPPSLTSMFSVPSSHRQMAEHLWMFPSLPLVHRNSFPPLPFSMPSSTRGVGGAMTATRSLPMSRFSFTASALCSAFPTYWLTSGGKGRPSGWGLLPSLSADKRSGGSAVCSEEKAVRRKPVVLLVPQGRRIPPTPWASALEPQGREK